MKNIKFLRKDLMTFELPQKGFVRWKQLQYILPFSREHWRKQVRDNLAPQPIKFGTRCTMWRCEDIDEYLKQLGNTTKQ